VILNSFASKRTLPGQVARRHRCGTLEAYLSDIHPDDFDRVRATIGESLRTGSHHLEYRILWPDGSTHWLEASGADLDAEPALPIDKKEALYRIAQEALHNAATHAHAHVVRLGLRVGNGRIRLEVADDGVGFDSSARYAGHLGLVSMQERAAGAGGTLSIASAAGRGTRVVADLPTCD
jgi:signal transduction histidine kinase